MDLVSTDRAGENLALSLSIKGEINVKRYTFKMLKKEVPTIYE